MKIASSGTSFDHRFANGDLTQLEWLAHCASYLALDGVVFEARYFPRTDDEYLAQLKKTAVDLGLTVAAVASDELPQADGERWIDIAARLGAPLVITRLPGGDAFTAWNAAAASLKQVAATAKRANIVVALRNAPETLCADIADLKRMTKDVDSSWIRHAPNLTMVHHPASTPSALAHAVIACCDIDPHATHDEDQPWRALREDLGNFRGYLTIDATGGEMSEQDFAHRIAMLRQTLHPLTTVG